MSEAGLVKYIGDFVLTHPRSADYPDRFVIVNSLGTFLAIEGTRLDWVSLESNAAFEFDDERAANFTLRRFKKTLSGCKVLAMAKQDPLVKAVKKAYRATDRYKLDKLLAEESRWKRKVTISTNKLAEVREEINKLAKELTEVKGGQDENAPIRPANL
jgi:hypothetical protein